MSVRALSVEKIRDGIASRDFSSREITREFLDAIKQDDHNIFLSTQEAAMAQAAAADERIESGTATPLTGIPYAVKDVLTTKGITTTAASLTLKEYVPPYTATAVARLEEAGMVLLGKTNCDEFAMGSSNENSAYGTVKNPVDPARVAGGSSGGSAAAVAAGLAPAALGSDTGGSVRLPAAFCGVVGFKPTYGRVSRSGLIAMASSLDHVGLLTRTPFDAALMLEVMAGHDPLDATSSREPVPSYSAALALPREKLHIGLPKEYFVQNTDSEFQERVDALLGLYRSLPDVELVEISLPNAAQALAVYYIIMSSEVSSNMARYDGIRYGLRAGTGTGGALESWYAENRSQGLGAEVQRRIMLGTYSLSAGYYDQYYAQASKVRTLIARDFEKAFHSVDVILSPTSPTPAFKIGEKIVDPLTMYLSDVYTVSANLAGIPAVSFPAGLVRGLPVGMQLMAPAWNEIKLLASCKYLMDVGV